MSLSADPCCTQGFWVLQRSFSKVLPLAQGVQKWSISRSHWAVRLFFPKLTLLCRRCAAPVSNHTSVVEFPAPSLCSSLCCGPGRLQRLCSPAARLLPWWLVSLLGLGWMEALHSCGEPARACGACRQCD